MQTARRSIYCAVLVLSFAVASAQENLALLGTASQTSDYGVGQFPASLAIDGNLGNFTATLASDDNAMWEVDLGAAAEISSIVLHNRDNCCPSRLRDIVVSIHDISFLEDDPIDGLLLGIPVEEVEAIWDSAIYETEVLNLENELGGSLLNQGPETLTIDLLDREGEPVTGRFVRVLRIADTDLSGSGGGGGGDEVSILSLGEVEVYGESTFECPTEGDTHCEEILVTPPLDGGPGLYEVQVLADDDSGDNISYTIVAKKVGQPPLVSGPGIDNFTTFELGVGTWTISATVDDGLFCDDVADDATCLDVTVEIENLTGNFALEGIASQTSDWNGNQLPAWLANDGISDNFTATDTPDENPMWEVDLLQDRAIGTIVLHNRADCCQSRLRDIIVSIHDIPYTDDEPIDDRVNGIPIDEIEPVWDSALFESAVLNPENIEGGATIAGPAQLTVDVEGLAGEKVTGRYVRVLRISDPDLSGTGGAGNEDEPNVLTLAEVEVLGESACAEEDPDTHCEVLNVTEPPAGGPGSYEVSVIADDDSGDTIWYTITATQTEGGDEELVFGPDEANVTTFDLTIGTWSISATVSDKCGPEDENAICDPVILVVEEDELGIAFIRGDANDDGAANISDASYILNFLFLGGPDLPCLTAGDANEDGATNISDASYILNFLFLGGPDIAPPNNCGDPPRADEADCLSSQCEPQ